MDREDERERNRAGHPAGQLSSPPVDGPPSSVPTVILLVLLTLAAFLPVLGNGFVWDDELYLLNNPRAAGGLTLAGLGWALTTFHAANWHPLTWVSHFLDVELFGLRPAGHHLVSLLWHAGNVVLLFLLLLRLTGARGRSALVAALFAVHPLHVESVAWVAERKDVLSTFFALAAVAAYLRYLRRPRPAAYLTVFLLFALALAAKPMPVTLPFLLLLLDWWPLGRWHASPAAAPAQSQQTDSRRRHPPGRVALLLAEKVPLLALSAASAAVTLRAQASWEAVGSLPLGIRLANAVQAYAGYLGKTVWPRGLAILYPLRSGAPPAWRPLSALLLLSVVTLLVRRTLRRAPALAAGWLWFLVTLVPVIGLVQVGTQAMADRYSYLPLVGVFIMAAWAIDLLPPLLRLHRTAMTAACCLLALSLAGLTFLQSRYWKDTPTVFDHALRVTGDNRVAHYNLGVYRQGRGELRQAAEHYREAIRIKEDYADAHNNLGVILAGEGKTAEAISHYRRAIRADRSFAEAWCNLGVQLFEEGKAAESAAAFREALVLRPSLAEARAGLGNLLAHQGRIVEARDQLQQAVRLRPDSAPYHNALGAAFAELGERTAAVLQFREALRLDPEYAPARENLGASLTGGS